MDANPQGVGSLGMTFADDDEEVKNFTFQQKGPQIELDEGMETRTGCSLFEFSYCNRGVVHYRLCGQNELKN